MILLEVLPCFLDCIVQVFEFSESSDKPEITRQDKANWELKIRTQFAQPRVAYVLIHTFYNLGGIQRGIHRFGHIGGTYQCMTQPGSNRPGHAIQQQPNFWGTCQLPNLGILLRSQKRVVEAYEKQNATIAFIRNQLRGQPYDVILLKMALFLQWADQKRPQHAIDFQTDMFAIFGFELDRTALEIWQRLQPFLTKMHEGSVKRSLLLIYKSECRCRNVEFVEFMLKHQTRIRIEKLKGADRVRQDPRYAGEPMFDLYAFHDKPTGGIIPTWFPEDERNMTYLPRLG
ncbi:hypothetical protein FPQ18DRAFT_309995 [Pyronema domesticum]|nr:hypothetical protein FPQ18DRAFT_309995 [Pyronema domesticum]